MLRVITPTLIAFFISLQKLTVQSHELISYVTNRIIFML